MANKTFSEMFLKVVRRTGLNNTFSDGTEETESIKEDINDIQKEVLTRSKTYLKKSGVAVSGGTVASQESYDIPTTVDKVSSIKITVSSIDYFPKKITIPHFQSLANTNQVSDIPVFYTIDENKIFIYPTPASNSNVIEVNANIYATDLETDPSSSTDSTTALEIKEGFENVIYYYALSEVYYRLEDTAMGDRAEKKYDKLFEEYKKEVKNTTNNLVVKHGTPETVNPNYYSTLTN